MHKLCAGRTSPHMDTGTMNILVTGSSGFIARFLIPALAAKGHCVVGLDKRPGPAFGDYFRFVYAHILDDGAVEDAIRHAEMVIHLAAEHKDFGVPESLYYQVNVDGTETLLRHAARSQIRSFVFYSSVAVYGDRPTPTTKHWHRHPSRLMANQKLLAEQRVQQWIAQDTSRKAIIVRPTVVSAPTTTRICTG